MTNYRKNKTEKGTALSLRESSAVNCYHEEQVFIYMHCLSCQRMLTLGVEFASHFQQLAVFFFPHAIISHGVK